MVLILVADAELDAGAFLRVSSHKASNDAGMYGKTLFLASNRSRCILCPPSTASLAYSFNLLDAFPSWH